MNTTIPFPTRYLVIMGVLIGAAALFLVARPVLLGSSDDTVGAVPTTPTSPPAATPPPSTPSTPKVVLLPGLPPQVANKLRYSKVVVVSLYQGSSRSDRAAVAAARAGARSVGAGFLAVNVLNEKAARSLQSFVGPTSTPAVVVVRRPGRIASSIAGAGSADSELVAQAAHNAGAGGR
jgi:hypothetical protein